MSGMDVAWAQDSGKVFQFFFWPAFPAMMQPPVLA